MKMGEGRWGDLEKYIDDNRWGRWMKMYEDDSILKLKTPKQVKIPTKNHKLEKTEKRSDERLGV